METLLDNLEETAKSYQDKGEIRQALEIYKEIISSDPNNFCALFNMSLLSFKSNQIPLAVSFGIKALKCRNPDMNSLVQLIEIFERSKDFDMAQITIQRILELYPDNMEVLKDIGLFYYRNKIYNIALKYFEKFQKYRPDLDLYIKMGVIAHSELNYADKALEFFLKAKELSPESHEIYQKLGVAYSSKGMKKEAEECFKKSIEIKKSAITYFTLAKIKKFTNKDKELIDEIKLFYEDSDHETEIINFTLGKIYNDLKEYDLAFAHYKMANDFLDKQKSSNSEKSIIDRAIEYDYINIFTKEFNKSKKDYSIQSSQNIFITGMPRSGTSLIDQILSSHSKIFSTGERQFLKDVIIKGNVEQQMKDLKDIKNEAITKAGIEYIDLSQNYLKENINKNDIPPKIVNKAIYNSFFIGVILLLFPNSKIINCYRHPLDICLSIYFQYFSALDFSFNLEKIAKFYKKFSIVDKAWHKQFPENIMDVYYEEIVNNQIPVSKEIISFIGLEYEDSCSKFYKTKNTVYTASIAEVRLPIYQTSRYRWKKYEKHIQILKDLLSDEIEEYEKNSIK